MIGGFRKKSKRGNIRQKITTESDDDQEEEEENSVVPPVQSASVKKSGKITKSSSVLSFNDEMDNGDEFVVKKTKASLNFEDNMKKEKKEKRQKKKKVKDVDNNSNANILSSRNTNKPIIKTFNEDELEEDDVPRFSIGGQKYGGGGHIPDAATIYAMKKQREQARQFGGQANYIPVNSNTVESRFGGKEKSRLVREEMEADSSDEDRIEMKGSTTTSHPALERRKQVQRALEEAQDDVNVDQTGQIEDDEFQKWEKEQIKKGSQIPAQQLQSYGPTLPTSSIDHYNMYNMMPTQGYHCPPTLSAGYAPQMLSAATSIPTTDTQILNVDIVIKRLKDQLDTKTQLHRLHEQEKEETKRNLESATNTIAELKLKTGDLSDKFEFYQEMHGFVRDLCECLNEKVKRLNELEISMHNCLTKKAEKVLTRRQDDVKDEVDEINGKTSSDYERVSNIRNRRIAEREGRRQQRREKRLVKNESHYEGMSSDDEMLTSDNLRFEAEKKKLMNEATHLFDDVVEDFTSIQEIMSRFEQWKFGFKESYENAYLSVCLPKLFTPFVKLEMLNWSPFEPDECVDFEEMTWFQTLALYADCQGEFEKNDEDLKLLPNIIEKVLIPKLTDLLKAVWDPLSTKQTKLCVFLFQRLVDDYPTITKDSKQTKTLVACIVDKLKLAIDRELYIPLYPQALLETKNSKALVFLERQFWKSVKLLSNVMSWAWILSQKKLQEFGIDAILNRYIIIALQQFPQYSLSLEKSKIVIGCLPKEWFEKSDQVIPGLESFARYLKSLASNVHKSCLGYTDEEEKKKAILLIKKIITLLMHIQAFDDARTVANTYKDDLKKDTFKQSPD